MSQDYMTPEERAEHTEHMREWSAKANRENWAEGEAGRLCEELYRAYLKYQQYLERNHFAKYQSQDVEAVSQQLYLQLQENLAKPRVAERCLHIKSNVSQSGPPRIKKSSVLFAHTRIKETSDRSRRPPPL